MWYSGLDPRNIYYGKTNEFQIKYEVQSITINKAQITDRGNNKLKCKSKMLRERNQIQKNISCIIRFIWNPRKVIATETESTILIASGQKWGEDWLQRHTKEFLESWKCSTQEPLPEWLLECIHFAKLVTFYKLDLNSAIFNSRFIVFKAFSFTQGHSHL